MNNDTDKVIAFPHVPTQSVGTKKGAGTVGAREQAQAEGIERWCQTADEAAGWVVEVASLLLDRQVERLAVNFENEGGFTEPLYKEHSARRRTQQ